MTNLSTWFTHYSSGTAKVNCNNAQFGGDPKPNVPKQCICVPGTESEINALVAQAKIPEPRESTNNVTDVEGAPTFEKFALNVSEAPRTPGPEGEFLCGEQFYQGSYMFMAFGESRYAETCRCHGLVYYGIKWKGDSWKNSSYYTSSFYQNRAPGKFSGGGYYYNPASSDYDGSAGELVKTLEDLKTHKYLMRYNGFTQTEDFVCSLAWFQDGQNHEDIETWKEKWIEDTDPNLTYALPKICMCQPGIIHPNMLTLSEEKIDTKDTRYTGSVSVNFNAACQAECTQPTNSMTGLSSASVCPSSGSYAVEWFRKKQDNVRGCIKQALESKWCDLKHIIWAGGEDSAAFIQNALGPPSGHANVSIITKGKPKQCGCTTLSTCAKCPEGSTTTCPQLVEVRNQFGMWEITAIDIQLLNDTTILAMTTN